MLDDHADASANQTTTPAGDQGAPSDDTASPAKRTARKRTTKKAAASVDAGAAPVGDAPDGDEPKKKTAAKKTAKKAASKSAAAKAATAAEGDATAHAAADTAESGEKPKKKAAGKKSTSKKSAQKAQQAEASAEAGEPADGGARSSAAPLFQAPEKSSGRPAQKPAAQKSTAQRSTGPKGGRQGDDADGPSGDRGPDDTGSNADQGDDGDDSADSPARRKRRRGGRRRRKSGDGESAGEQNATENDDATDEPSASDTPAEGESSSSRRRRRRRRSGEDGGDSADDPANTVTRVRSGRSAADEITAVSGSTRLEAKKQRRREGREAGRRRAPIVSEAEFLARRESVNRVMVIRQRDDVTQIGVLEDNVLVEHYVARESQTSLIGNVYLGRVQNVLPSMEAAFIDIGKGRNAVLYAGEVNWSALGHKDGQPRKIESVLSSGQTVLVQVTKDPIGHKGARLTSQISLAGRFLVYVPDGTTSGISRKLPDTERNRLKTLLKEIVPEHAGVIVRTAAEGASEDELTRDVERLTARWDDIEKKAKGSAPQLLYGEPDLTLKVVRDLFTEDFAKLVIEGEDAWETVQSYVVQVAPDLEDRLERYEPKKDQDVFAAYRIDEQIKKGLDRKVWLPSGGSLIIDRTEAMTVVDVNTGKFTGSGGNLEETVTKNNLEAAEEIVRQLRLRDIGGIIVVDFIDMVLESNRDLVLRRLVECLGRDRTRHQVAEVTSLGLVQMTRKRIGTGLLESFSHDCPHCHGRGVVIEEAPVEPKKAEEEPRRARRSRSRGRAQDTPEPARPSAPSPKDVAAMARHHDEHPDDHLDDHPDDRDDHTDDQVDDQLDDRMDEVEDFSTDDQPADVAPAAEDQTDDTSVGATEELVQDAAEATTSEAVDETPVESTPEPAPPAEPEKPRVVTRTRRRSASRPAGPPAATADGATDGGAGGAADGEVDGMVDGMEHVVDETPALHVPVKRKGARKR